MLKRVLLIAAVVLCGGVQSFGDIIGFDFSTLPGGVNNYGPSPLNANSTGGGGIATAQFLRGSGVSTAGTAAASAWGGTGFTDNTAVVAITGSRFYTLAIATNNTVSFSDIGPYNVRRSSTGPTTGLWQYSIGAGSFTDIGSSFSLGSGTGSGGNTMLSVNLSSIGALQSVSAGSTVNLRLVGFNASSSAGTFYLNDFGSPATANDFTVNFTAVPEPSSIALVSFMGCAGLVAAYRRRKAKSKVA